jgi:hypothetical protein
MAPDSLRTLGQGNHGRCRRRRRFQHLCRNLSSPKSEMTDQGPPFHEVTVRRNGPYSNITTLPGSTSISGIRKCRKWESKRHETEPRKEADNKEFHRPRKPGGNQEILIPANWCHEKPQKQSNECQEACEHEERYKEMWGITVSDDSIDTLRHTHNLCLHRRRRDEGDSPWQIQRQCLTICEDKVKSMDCMLCSTPGAHKRLAIEIVNSIFCILQRVSQDKEAYLYIRGSLPLSSQTRRNQNLTMVY